MTVSTTHYGAAYLYKERWLSFVYQVTALSGIEPARVAEIGIGPGVVGEMVRANYPECGYVGIDIDETLSPSVCASVSALPFADGSFDATFCCQVLEHMPFEQFAIGVRELKRITRQRLVISLPDVSPFLFLRFSHSRRLLPGLWNGISLPVLFPHRHSFAEHGQHYWEIGKRHYPFRRVRQELEKIGFREIRHFRMTERSYWHFFILDVN
jgi:SAM-dependent methyltransferase